MGRRCSAVVLSLFLLAMGRFAFGSEFGNIHFGQLYVHPRIGVEVMYDDNIFLLGKTKQDDVLFKIKPGVDFDYNRDGKSVRLNYLAEIGRYVDNTDYDYDNHMVDAAVDLQFPSGLMFFVGDVFRRTIDRLTYEEYPLVKRTENTSDVKVGYEFTDRLSFRVGYDHMILDYEDAPYKPDPSVVLHFSDFDRDMDLATGTVFYRILNAVSLLGQIEYMWIDYDQEVRRSDAEGISGWVGVTGQLTPKMTALIKGGWQERDYDGPQEDWGGGVFTIDIVHRCTETLLVSVGGSRRAVESTYDVNNYFTATEGRAGLEKQVGPKVTVSASAFYANSDYPEATLHAGHLSERSDDIWGARVGLRYDIQQWLSTSFWYTHEERNSNHDAYDYDDNRVSLGVSAVF